MKSDCIEGSGATLEMGYKHIRVNGKLKLAHRVAWEEVNGPIPDGMCICHHCDNPPCVNVGHLFMGTNADNTKDRHEKGRTAKGESHGAAKLTEGNVGLIRRMYGKGLITQVALARAFGVRQANIALIVNRKTWRHIE